VFALGRVKIGSVKKFLCALCVLLRHTILQNHDKPSRGFCEFGFMKTNFLSLFAAFLFASATLALGATNDLSRALQKGLFEEEANHNLEAAAQAYQSVAAQFDKDRKLAATAIFRLGEVYRKQGKTNEANAQYERILREFPDQTELVKLSRDYIPANQVSEQTAETAKAQKNAEENEIARIKTMIKDSPDLINAASGPTGTPLQVAAQNGWLNAAKFLLANGADVNRKSGNNAPLHLAIQYGRKAMVELLIANGANLELPDSTGGTALHLASRMGFKAIVEILLKNKADVNARNSRQNDGDTPLHLAAAAGYKAVAELLLANGANVNAKNLFGVTPLFSAIGAKNFEMAKFLTANNADVNATAENNSTPLLQAITRSQPKLMELLLQNGANTETKSSDNNYQGWTALDWAISKGESDLVKILLGHGANPNSASAIGATPLHYAAMWNKREMAELLLAHKAA
jgi:ankyrin repeat protein